MLALVCGTGTLPALVAKAQPEKPLVCVLDGFAPDALEADLNFRLETLGTLLIQLGQRGVTEVCLCGAINRPILDPTKLDEHTAPLIPLIAGALTTGDDGALRAIMGLFEQTGFAVRAAHELVPDLVAPPGVLSEKWPNAQMRDDAKLGADVLAALAPMDVGQACVTGGGQLIGMETIGGTNFMLGHLPETPLCAQGVLVKGPKTGQDTRADMPTIGPATIEAAQKAGLVGVVIDAGDVILLEHEKCIAMANAAGMVLWSRTGE
ncbi:MAG: DUF1009 family protein [Candidatus Azotimanducaceae bacterium]|jgi:DUF1009 family protein